MKARYVFLVLSIVELLVLGCVKVPPVEVTTHEGPSPTAIVVGNSFQADLRFVEAIQTNNIVSPVKYVYSLVYQNAAQGFVLVAGTERLTGLSAFLSSEQTIDVPVAPGVTRPVVIYITDGKENLVFSFNVSASEWPERVFPSIASIPFDLEVVNQIYGGSGDLLELEQGLVQFPDRFKLVITDIRGEANTGCDGMSFDYTGKPEKGQDVWLNFSIDVEVRSGSKAIFKTLLVEPWVRDLDTLLAGYSGKPGFSILYNPGYPGKALLYAEIQDANGTVYAKCKVLLEVAP